jgi:hypothetical protein
MKLQHTVVAAIIFACAVNSAPAKGADKLTGQLIRAYNAGKYESAEALGEKLIARRPTDYSAHYYLANTYVRLHKNEEAMDQYRICLGSGAAGQLKEYSSTALERLLKQKEQGLIAASQAEKPQEKEIAAFRKKLRKESKDEERSVRQEWNQALNRLDGNYGNRNQSFRRFGYYRNNESERYRINNYYSRKMSELQDYEASMMSQANCGTSKIRLAPSLSSSKVKNYINYGDQSDAVEIPVDNPLHAQARSLSDPPLKSPAAAAKQKVAPPAKHNQSKSTALGSAHR